MRLLGLLEIRLPKPKVPTFWTRFLRKRALWNEENKLVIAVLSHVQASTDPEAHLVKCHPCLFRTERLRQILAELKELKAL